MRSKCKEKSYKITLDKEYLVCTNSHGDVTWYNLWYWIGCINNPNRWTRDYLLWWQERMVGGWR